MPRLRRLISSAAIRARSGGAWLVVTPAIILAAVAAVYTPTLAYGFHYDDYHFVRPYTTAEVLATFRGPWDATRIETPYYRPLTICLYAARFAVLGLHARAHHVMSLLMFAFAATLFTVFVLQITASRTAAVLGAIAFAVHPGLPYSAVVWVTNQMHLAAMIVVFTAFTWWFHVRARPARWWWPLLALQAAAFFIKEDGVMLIPAIVALHVLRRSMVEPALPRLPASFVVAAALVGGTLLLLRSSALHGVPAHQLPSLDQSWTNWTRALESAFRLLPARRPWQASASWFVTLAPIAALLLYKRLSREMRFALAAGPAIGVLFVLPFAFIVKAEQLHLVTAGAALLLAASLAGLVQAFRPRAVQAIMIGVAVAGLAAMAAVARHITRDFEPFGPIVLHTDHIVEEWAAVPAEIREYLAAKASAPEGARPDADPSRALAVVAFGLHGRERSPDGVSLRWMAGSTADVFVRRGIRLISFPMRHEIGAFREPAHVTIEADGRVVSDTVLSDGRWHRVDVALRQRAATGLSGMHRVRVRLDHAWIPARVIPGSGDGRVLGLQIGVIETR